MATITADDNWRNDYRVLSVIGIGHFMSHFYYMVLPPLFVQMREAFGVSYVELGTLIALMSAASAIVQVPIGFLVDRLGARIVLIVGMLITAASTALIGLAPSFWLVVALAFCAGVGNAVFHPTDYAILNASISARRMGRAFSIHTFAGHLGTAAAPVAMVGLTALFGWRIALVAAGAFGVVALGMMASQFGAMREDLAPASAGSKKARAADDPDRSQGGLALLLSRPMLMFFVFFTVLSMTQTGLQAFAVAALVTLHDMPVATASLGLSVYLFTSAAGVLLGGELADRTTRHDLFAGAVFGLTAVVTVIFAVVSLPAALLALLMGVIGLGQGATRPARDMMLRAATPKGSTGKVFGFVTSGIAVGSALAPIPLGHLLDIGQPAWVFYLISIFMVVAIVSMLLQQTSASGSAARVGA
jgi:MFS family permease